ncbi:hypothetical protein PoB_006924600 [Plakobranchus ocellatus]|uniref:Uncharacterized protein n=1 Tax=Plakobranchus ocellatus TaxID=259542 RepID=A0AAV4DEY1_9GAST|nr:hypothetical protein PoB_006924600 [Plakobranchus ocellatus]
MAFKSSSGQRIINGLELKPTKENPRSSQGVIASRWSPKPVKDEGPKDGRLAVRHSKSFCYTYNYCAVDIVIGHDRFSI